MPRPIKILHVTAVDATVKAFLLPLIDRLIEQGYHVEVTCSNGPGVPDLEFRGYTVHKIDIKRKISPVSNLRSLWQLYRLMREQRFDIVHVHTPVAAALGRLAAWAARVPVIIYTVHGFYFHEHMPAWKRRPIIWAEKFLGCITDVVFTASQEDAATAVKEAICSKDKLTWIGNGVNIRRFSPEPGVNGTRSTFGLDPRDKVVGFVGRLVGEKGLKELLEAMSEVIKVVPEAKLLLVGDTLDSDRDTKTKQAFSSLLARNGLAAHVLFTGFIEDIPRVMKAIDVFVLPSYREGLPVSVMEAMASGRPVVATDIRGCREEVVPGSTGLLVPVKDPAALASAITIILSDPELAARMGAAGRRRAAELFDERFALDKQVKAYARIVSEKLMPQKRANRKFVQPGLKRAADITISFACLTFLAFPFLIAAALIKLESSGPVFFRQERIGKDGRPFRVWKLRTMVDGAVNQGLGLNVAKDDNRLTRVGKVLRNWGLDELPQLINVLAGEMSLIGPRPTLRHQVEQYTEFQRQRLMVKPGISSLAVIAGRNSLSWKQRIRLDVWYIRHWSIWLDLKIVFSTLWSVLVTRKGIYGEGGVNPDFVPSRVKDEA